MSRRGSTPLFELLRESEAPSGPADRAWRPDDEDGDHGEAEGGVAAGGSGRGSVWRGRLVMPVATVWAAAAAFVAFGLLCYAVGHRVGVGASGSGFGDETLAIEEPIGLESGLDRGAGPFERPPGSPVNGPVGAGGSRGGSSGGSSSGGSAGGGSAGGDPGLVLSADGRLLPDPRRPETNYLHLATLSEAEARDGLEFLRREEIPSIAVPVDPSGRRANTSPRYVLVSLGVSIPSERYSSLGGRRAAHERDMKRLGRSWKSSGGASDFASAFWKKHTAPGA